LRASLNESHSAVFEYPFPVPLPFEEKKKTNAECCPYHRLRRPSLPHHLKQEPKSGDWTSQVTHIVILRGTPSKPSLICIVFNPIPPKIVFHRLDISKCVRKIEFAPTRSGDKHEMVRVVPVVNDVIFRKRHHCPSLTSHESARAKVSAWNYYIVVLFVKEPQNKAGSQSSAIPVVACQCDQNDDTWNGELRSIRSQRAY